MLIRNGDTSSVNFNRPAREAGWVHSANLRFALVSRLRRPQLTPYPGRCRFPLWLQTCHRHICLTRRALKGKAFGIHSLLKSQKQVLTNENRRDIYGGSVPFFEMEGLSVKMFLAVILAIMLMVCPALAESDV